MKSLKKALNFIVLKPQEMIIYFLPLNHFFSLVAVICPPDSTYSSCVAACRPSCGSIQNLNTYECNYPCVPGCQCDFLGDVFQNGQCIAPTQCGCYDANGNYYQVSHFLLFLESCAFQNLLVYLLLVPT